MWIGYMYESMYYIFERKIIGKILIKYINSKTKQKYLLEIMFDSHVIYWSTKLHVSVKNDNTLPPGVFIYGNISKYYSLI